MSRFSRRLAISILAALVTLPQSAPAQCTPTLTGAATGPQYGAGLSASQFSTSAMLATQDSAGPMLVISGSFVIPPARTQSPFVDYAARYQHGRWTKMDAGLPGPAYSLVEADFSSVGGSPSSIYAVTISGSTVYRWTGSTWSSIGSSGGGGTSSMLLPYSDAQGPILLAAGGDNNGVRAWRGTGAWTDYGALNGFVSRVAIADDGSGPTVFAAGSSLKLAKLVNGAWQQAALPPGAVINSLTDVTTFDDGSGPALYIAGYFSIPGVSPCNAARLRAGVWEALGGGVTLSSNSSPAPRWLKITSGGATRLFLGGRPDRSNQYAGLLEWTASGWTAPTYLFDSQGQVGATMCAAAFNDGDGDALYFGGPFYRARASYASQFDWVYAFSTLRFKAGRVESLSRGLPFASSLPAIRYTLAAGDGGQGPTLYAGGPFSSAGGRAGYAVAAFDGSAWSPRSFPTTSSIMVPPTPVPATVAGVARLYANFGNVLPSAIGWWDGSQWQPITPWPPSRNISYMMGVNNALYTDGGGLHRFDGSVWTANIISGQVSAMAVGDLGQGPRLYVGASGPTGPGVYEVLGTIATRLGPTLPQPPSGIAIHNDGSGPHVYAAEIGLPGNIARLNNNVWEPLGGGLVPNGQSFALASFDDGHGPALYVAGQFSRAGTEASPGFARWRAGAWTTVTPAVPNTPVMPAASLAVFNNRFYIAGGFTSIGALPADHFAWLSPCPRTCTADYNGDGDVGTDADIEAFFRCLGGTCCPQCTADYNNDGDNGTDRDIEAFFRVLAGGNC